MYTNKVENIFGSKKRLAWVKGIVDKSCSIVDLGCGTGHMLTIPLLKCGYDIIGIDTHKKSIEYGQNILQEKNISVEKLKCCQLSSLDGDVDTIIASEVIEHMKLEEIKTIFVEVRKKLKRNGTFLVTVPNGHGWFEVENYFWNKLEISALIERFNFHNRLSNIKEMYFDLDLGSNELSTLDSSPHIQSFTYRSIQKLLIEQGFEIVSATGSVFFCGPLSHILFRGIVPLLNLNCYLGRLFPRVASGYFIHCQIKEN